MKRLLTIFAVTLIIGFLLPNSALAEEVSPEHQEGYVQQGDGCYYVVSWCKGHEENNSRSIYGEFCFPDSYEEIQDGFRIWQQKVILDIVLILAVEQKLPIV